MSDHREQAAGIVAAVADRLSDPDLVRATLAAEPVPRPRLSLDSGYPAVAVLFAELGRREATHATLATAIAEPPEPADESLYSGLPALAFAVRAGVVDPRDYGSLLPPLHTYVAELAGARAASWRRELVAEHRTAPWTMGSFDVISGLSGLGRYLLMAAPEPSPALEQVLRFLVEITEPREVRGSLVPGWWVDERPWLVRPAHTANSHAEGHANLGVAHGIPGPLALLAIAWQAGVRVPGQQAAMERIVDWLLRWRRPDRDGCCWPETISLDEHLGRAEPVARCVATWCYGVPGIGRAIQLAGLALDRADWRQVAVDAMASLLDRPERQWRLHSASVCHGWAGLLHVALRIAADGGSGAATEVAELAAARTIALFDPDLPFGYRYPTPAGFGPSHGVGLLDGASGTALALHGYATNRLPETAWDAALLMG